jgi:glucose/arabinose dehydrogenase
MHHGGEIAIGPDSNIYVVLGNIEGDRENSTSTRAQNFENGTEPDGRAGILHVTQDGKRVENGIIGNNYPLNLYYAYGIRNSFGMDFDPVTGKLWDTENGPSHGDEINLVEPGFNSGSDDVYGMSYLDDKFDPNKLVTFGGKGKYSDPEFVWDVPVGPTAIKFIDSDRYGDEFKNDLLVGDINNGYLYHFDLNNERDMLLLNGTLADKLASFKEELEDIIFMDGFKGITDIQVSPDGYIYVLGNQSIYKILPNKVN